MKDSGRFLELQTTAQGLVLALGMAMLVYWSVKEIPAKLMTLPLCLVIIRLIPVYYSLGIVL